ncbi:hypothetical protein CPAV1605_954 [seawater metagenome]|uniref:Uncharacterized protein n=1 Tax=seawater metagenome TaxID=1561972 RepID=A0A5E8CKL2_9ZZZZ
MIKIKINIYYFFVSLCIGIFLVYITAPKPRVVVKYPNLSNYKELTYVDDSGVCYKYEPVEVDCNKENIDLPEDFEFKVEKK